MTELAETVKTKRAAAKTGDTATVLDLIKGMRDQFALALPRHLDPDRFVRVALTTLRLNPALQACSAPSLLGALTVCAQLGLEPDMRGQAYLVPFGRGGSNQKEVQLIVGYRGEIELAYRSGAVASIVARTVHANDRFEWSYGTDEHIMHKPALVDRGELVAVYAIAQLKSGGAVSVVLSVEDVNKFRARSRAGKTGPWVTDYEAMAMKTAVRRLATWLPQSVESAELAAVDQGVVIDIPSHPDTVALSVADAIEADPEPDDDPQPQLEGVDDGGA